MYINVQINDSETGSRLECPHKLKKYIPRHRISHRLTLIRRCASLHEQYVPLLSTISRVIEGGLVKEARAWMHRQGMCIPL